MGLRFRKRIGLGLIKLNITGKGINSVSVGSPGATVNLPTDQRKPSVTVGLPGTGLSYRETLMAPEEQQPSTIVPAMKIAAEFFIGQLLGKLLGSILFGSLGRRR